MSKYICKKNATHIFSEPTPDFWCPLCERNTGMLELVIEESINTNNDDKLNALNLEIDTIKKDI